MLLSIETLLKPPALSVKHNRFHNREIYNIALQSGGVKKVKRSKPRLRSKRLWKKVMLIEQATVQSHRRREAMKILRP